MFKDWNDLPLMLTVKLTAAVTGYGQARIRELCRGGRMPHVRWGRAYQIPRDKLRSWLEWEAEASVRDFPGFNSGPHDDPGMPV